jgi:hypothetical protein
MSDGILFDLTEDSLADEAVDDVSDRFCAACGCGRVFSRCN